MSAAFKVGDLVHLRADPSRRGAIVAILPALAGRGLRYRIYHANAEVREYHEDQLAADQAVSIMDDLAEALVMGTGCPLTCFALG